VVERRNLWSKTFCPYCPYFCSLVIQFDSAIFSLSPHFTSKCDVFSSNYWYFAEIQGCDIQKKQEKAKQCQTCSQSKAPLSPSLMKDLSRTNQPSLTSAHIAPQKLLFLCIFTLLYKSNFTLHIRFCQGRIWRKT